MEMSGIGFLFTAVLLTLLAITSLSILLYVRYLKLKRLLEKAKDDRPYTSDGPDVIVVGGGIVGSAMAAVLARDGRKVTVIERSMEMPDRVIGEGMLSGALEAMKELGLNVTTSDMNSLMVYKMMMYPGGNRCVEIPLEKGIINAISGRHVQALRNIATAEERCSFIEGTVTSLCMDNGQVTGVKYHEKGSEETKTLTSPLTVVANGAYSKLRSVNVTRKPVPCSYSQFLEVEQEPNNGCAFIPTSVGPLFTVPISPVLRRFVFFPDKVSSRQELLRVTEEIPELYREMYRKAARDNRLRNSPVMYLPPVTNFVPGVLTIGDALSIRNAITAGGMMIGLKDVVIWRDLLRGIPDLHNHNAMLAAQNMFAVRRMEYSFVLDLFAYTIRHFFMPTTGGLELLSKSFGEYLESITSDFSRMLTGLDTRPQLLLYHLTVVLLRTMKTALTAGGLTGLPYGLYQATLALCSASATIIPHVTHQITSMLVFKSKKP